MTLDEQLQRQIGINVKLRRQLEQCRKDVVEECAKFCEERDGHRYANGLRGMIGNIPIPETDMRRVLGR